MWWCRRGGGGGGGEREVFWGSDVLHHLVEGAWVEKRGVSGGVECVEGRGQCDMEECEERKEKKGGTTHYSLSFSSIHHTLRYPPREGTESWS